MRGLILTKHIYQKNGNDCGVASLAMLFGVSYYRMRKLVFAAAEKTGRKFNGTEDAHDRAVANMFGEKVKIWVVTEKNRNSVIRKIHGRRAILTVPGIGYTSHADKSKWEWHAVYWDGERVYDPDPTDGRGYAKNGKRALASMWKVTVFADDCRYDSVDRFD